MCKNVSETLSIKLTNHEATRERKQDLEWWW